MKPNTATEKAIGVLSLNLIRWGVCPDVAASTTAAWLKAYNLREIQTWTNHPDATTIPPEEIVKNALGNCVPDHKISYELLEEAVFACLWSNIRKLADVVSMLSPMKANFESDPLAFWERLGKYSSKKIAGPSWVEKQPEWTFFVFEYWIGRGLPEDIPPVCLWTDADSGLIRSINIATGVAGTCKTTATTQVAAAPTAVAGGDGRRQ